jgi:hypothetical protein
LKVREHGVIARSMLAYAWKASFHPRRRGGSRIERADPQITQMSADLNRFICVHLRHPLKVLEHGVIALDARVRVDRIVPAPPSRRIAY